MWCKCQCMASHDQKNQVAPHFTFWTSGIQWCHWLCYWYHVMLMPMALCAIDTNWNSVTWPKMLCCISFQFLDLRNSAVPLTMPSASCEADADTIGITWHKNTCWTSLWSSWPKEFNGAIDDSISITWCQCQWCWMTKEVTLHLISMILT